MEKDLSNYRASYEKQELLESEVSDHPMVLFQTWFDDVDKHTKGETNAMTLSTVGLDGFPRSRVVLLKNFNDQGFTFYTNYESEKGKAIQNNPNVCLSFFWEEAERQIIIKGVAEKIRDKASDDYFNSRPRGSQLGALVSHQSEVIVSREVLERKLQALEKIYKNKDIPRPEFWGGFLIIPHEFEFWQGRPNRLHDRLRFKKSTDSNWTLERVSP